MLLLPFAGCSLFEDCYPLNIKSWSATKKSGGTLNLISEVDSSMKLKFLVIPAIVIPVAVGVIPFLIGLIFSFTDWNLTVPGVHFIGIQNYIEILRDSSFWEAVLVTIEFTGLAVGIEMLLGSFVAFLLSRNVRGQWFFRSIILIPLTVAPVLSALMWKLMLAPTGGVINYLLGFLGMPNVAWLSNPSTSLLSLVVIDVYINTPFVALLVFAGIQSLPLEPYEAAQVDGASGWFVFKSLTLPMLKPILILALVFRLILSLKTFDIIYATTRGGPAALTTNLHLWSYINSFQYGAIGYSMTGAAILFIMIFALSMWLIKVWSRSVSYMTSSQ